MRRVLILLGLCLPVLAGSWRYPLFDVAPAQLSANEERWAGLSLDQRAALRTRWNTLRGRLSDRSEGERTARRLGTLNRLLHTLGQQPDRLEVLVNELDDLPARLSALLGEPGSRPAAGAEKPAAAELTRLLRLATARRMTAFLGNLAREGRLGAEDMAAFDRADWDGKVGLALRLMKREALFFRAELGAAPGQAAGFDLDTLSPLDVAAHQEAYRRQRGLVGRAGRLLNLPTEKRNRLAQAEPESFARTFDEVVRPAARELLLERGFAQDRVDALMARPYRALERVLERLLRSRD